MIIVIHHFFNQGRNELEDLISDVRENAIPESAPPIPGRADHTRLGISIFMTCWTGVYSLYKM